MQLTAKIQKQSYTSLDFNLLGPLLPLRPQPHQFVLPWCCRSQQINQWTFHRSTTSRFKLMIITLQDQCVLFLCRTWLQSKRDVMFVQHSDSFDKTTLGGIIVRHSMWSPRWTEWIHKTNGSLPASLYLSSTAAMSMFLTNPNSWASTHGCPSGLLPFLLARLV